jgi:putative membrane protein
VGHHCNASNNKIPTLAAVVLAEQGSGSVRQAAYVQSYAKVAKQKFDEFCFLFYCNCAAMLKNALKLKYEFQNKEAIILRDFLALERTRLANERTLLAYLRTSLYMVLGGIAFLQMKDFESIRWLGYVSMVLNAAFVVTGIVPFIF